MGNEPFLQLADGPDSLATHELELAAEDRLVIFTAESGVYVPATTVHWRIVPWTQDALIEYLLSAHKAECASVMRRLTSGAGRRKTRRHR